MRRVLSIVLLLVLGLPLFASAFGSAQAESRLPLCCRRAGTHHCMEMSTPTEQHVVRMTCPAFPHSTARGHTGGWSAAAGYALTTEPVLQATVIGQAEAGYRISSGRAWQKRGPPVQNS